MLQYVAIISFAVGMGGMLEKLGVLEHILNAVVKRINSDGSMILVTLIVGYITSLISCSQPILYTSAYRPHCRISRPHFYPVGIRASGSTQSIWS